MPVLVHPRLGVMNHQPEGPTCFMSCALAVREFYSGAMVGGNGANPVAVAYKAFMRDHAESTSPPNYLKTVLNQGGYYNEEERVNLATDVNTVYNRFVNEIGAGKPILCGVYKPNRPLGHAFMIYGYDDIDNIYTADPILGTRKIPMNEIKSGYNGDPDYRWMKLIYTKH